MQRIYVYVKYNPEWQNLKFNSTSNKNKWMGKPRGFCVLGTKIFLNFNEKSYRIFKSVQQ